MFDKVEEVVEKIVVELEKKPISTTLKGLLVLWVLSKVIKWFNVN